MLQRQGESRDRAPPDSRIEVPLGTRSANPGATRQAEARVACSWGRYLRLSKKDSSPAPASSSGFTSWISVSGSAPCASCAPTFSASACRRSGAALSKNPGCTSIRRQVGDQSAAGRGYTIDDLPLLLACGTSACFVSILVLALYVNDGSAGMYTHPEGLWLLCPLALYWILRVWRKSFRGELHDDPVVFALRDWPSLLVGVLCCALLWLAI